MKKNRLDALPQEYFEYKISNVQKPFKQNLLAFLLLYLLLFMFVATNYVEGEVPFCVTISKALWGGLCVIYGMISIFYNVKKGRVSVYILLTIVAMGLFVIAYWMVISHFAIVLCCLAGGNTLDPTKTNLVFLLSVILLLAGVVLYIMVYCRIKKRIIQGEYKKGGKGFWDNHTRKKQLQQIAATAAPICMVFSSVSVFLSKFWKITWDNAYTPILAVAAPLLVAAMFIPLSYGNAISMMRVYYNRRFRES